jgi:hypothetical protein
MLGVGVRPGGQASCSSSIQPWMSLVLIASSW